MPDSGTIRPTLTSAGCCARATVDEVRWRRQPESTVRRVSDVFEILSDHVVLAPFVSRPNGAVCRWLHAEIGLADAVVRPQGLGCCLRARRGRPRARSRGRRIPAPRPRAARPAGSSGFDCRRISISRSKMKSAIVGARPIEGSSSIRSLGDEASPRPIASICCCAARQRAGELAAALGQDRQPFEDALEVVFPVALAGLGVWRPFRGSPSP